MSETATLNPTKYVQTPLTGQSPEMEKLGGMSLLNMVQSEPEEIKEVIEEKKPDEVVQDDFQEEVEEEKKEDEIPEIKDVPAEVVEEKKPEAEAVITEPEAELPTTRKAAKTAFAAKERQIKELQAKLKEIEPVASRVKELEEVVAKTPKVDPEIVTRLEAVENENKELKSQAENYKKELYTTNVEKSDEFKSLVTSPFENQIQPVIRAIVKATAGAVSKATIDDIVVTNDPSERHEKLRALREQLDPADYQELAAMVPKYREVIENRSKLTKNAEQTIALKQRESEQSMEKAREQYAKDLKEAFTATDSKTRTEMFAGVDIDADPELKEAFTIADKNLSGFDWYQANVPQQAAVRAALKNYPIALNLYKKQLEKAVNEKEAIQKELTDLKSATKKLTKASPSAGGTTTGAQKVDDTPQDFKGKLDGASLAEMLKS